MNILLTRDSFRIRGLIIATLFFCALGTATAEAASYDYFVKDGSSGDGSEGDPFGSIGKAIDELKDKGGDSIFVGKGSYSEGFTLPKGTALSGSDQGDVTITGLVQMGEETNLSKVTIASGGSILALKGADVEIEKVRVKNAIGPGIKAEAGRGTITIRDSIVESSRKGLYMQAGNELKFEGLEVRDNAEEGLDIREKVSGTIEKSEFRNNGESGIEVVLGDSTLVIRSNTFSGNGASGIAAQFFKGAKDVGNVRIEENRMSKNDYAIDCKAPQGGSSKFYFLNSLRISDNSMTDNRDGEIAKSCKIMTDEERIAFQEEEKKKSEEAAEAKTLTLSSEMLADRAAKAAMLRQEYDDVRQTREAEAIHPSVLALQTISDRLRASEETLRDHSKTSCLLFGKDARTEKALRLALSESGVLFDRLEKESDALEFDANRRVVEETISQAREMQTAVDSGLTESDCSFSFLGWARNLIESRRTPENLITDEEKMLGLRENKDPQKILFLGELAYKPELRRNVIKMGDDFFLQNMREELRQFDLVAGDLAVPFLTDEDPLPPPGSTTLLSFPTRFSNILSSGNIRFMHLGSALPFIRAGEESFEKTTTNLSVAGIASFGGANQGLAEVKPIPNTPLSLFEYRESKTSASDPLRAKIQSSKESGEVIVVYLVWDRALGASMTEERKKIARSFIDAGATLVLGSGLAIPAQSESYQSGRIAYSSGLVFDDTAVGLEKESKSLGFILRMGSGEAPIIEEKDLSFYETGGLKWKE